MGNRSEESLRRAKDDVVRRLNESDRLAGKVPNNRANEKKAEDSIRRVDGKRRDGK